MNLDEITLRSPRADEVRQFLEPVSAAFAEEFSDGEIDVERALMEPDRFINAFRGEDRVGSAGAYSFRLSVPGGEIGSAGITAVGVRPDQRRRGIMRRMMTWLLDDARQRGEPVAILTASQAAIYQRFGFGQGTIQSSFTAEAGRLDFREPIGDDPARRIRIVDANEAARIFPVVYEAFRRDQPGAVTRSEAKWQTQLLADPEWMRAGGGPKYRALLEVDGEPRGYAIYRIKSEWSPSGPNSVLNAIEVTGLDPVVEQTLWQWLLSIDLVGTVRTYRHPVPHPLQHWLLEPRRLGLTVGDGLWLRLLDVPAALAGRRYAGSGTVVLELTDALIESNAGRWQVTVEDGQATVERTAAPPDLSLDVAALASVYLGAFRFGDLARAGRVAECLPGALLTVDSLFTPTRAPWCSTPF
ncbi:MAG: GNAT family N-acetyltransferase [Chloroflexi bacterium]|nr:GNAT family N-acetyltransferase [Chloroflexota bacterium]